jgi:hypothetical protein
MPIAGQTLEHSYLRLLWGSLQPSHEKLRI